MIYFDNSATTKIDVKVLEAMIPYLKEEYGNSNGKYYQLANNAKSAVDNARYQIADFLNCKSDEVIFTSGATESNNTIIKGMLDYSYLTKQHFVTIKTEHASILDPFKFIERIGVNISYVDVDETGSIIAESLKGVLQKGADLFAFSHVNSEIGTVQNLDMIHNICLEYNVAIHLDVTQAISKCKLDINDYPMIHSIAFSSHKVHGPKGVGALIIRKDYDGIRRNITPLIHGGNQEFNFRAGTSPVHLIVGFGKAIELLNSNFDVYSRRIQELDNLFISLVKEKEEIVIVNSFADRVPGVISLRFKGHNNQIFLKKASPYFAASTGSACSNTKPSHVLKEIGLNPEEISETIRFSLSRYNTEKEINEFFEIL